MSLTKSQVLRRLLLPKLPIRRGLEQDLGLLLGRMCGPIVSREEFTNISQLHVDHTRTLKLDMILDG